MSFAPALDERLGISYLSAMATRLMLTLLALLTGLFAQLSPAQARIRAEGASAVGALAGVSQAERTAAARPQGGVRPVVRWRSEEPCSATMLRRQSGRQSDCAPPVMLGIDRARE